MELVLSSELDGGNIGMIYKNNFIKIKITSKYF